MRTFWEDLSKRIGETAESVSNKAGEAVEIQKLKSQIRALERGTEEDLIDLGRMVYEYFEAGNLVGSEAEGLCEAIRSRKQSIEDYEKRIIAVRGEFSCKNCGKTISNKMAYCPYCGEKMEAEATAEDENRQAKDAEADVIDYADVIPYMQSIRLPQTFSPLPTPSAFIAQKPREKRRKRRRTQWKTRQKRSMIWRKKQRIKWKTLAEEQRIKWKIWQKKQQLPWKMRRRRLWKKQKRQQKNFGEKKSKRSIRER